MSTLLCWAICTLASALRARHVGLPQGQPRGAVPTAKARMGGTNRKKGAAAGQTRPFWGSEPFAGRKARGAADRRGREWQYLGLRRAAGHHDAIDVRRGVLP